MTATRDPLAVVAAMLRRPGARPVAFADLVEGWVQVDTKGKSGIAALNTDTQRKLYGEAARRALARDGKKPAKAEPKRKPTAEEDADARGALILAVNRALDDPGAVDLAKLAQHLDAVPMAHLRAVRAAVASRTSKSKRGLVDAIMEKVRGAKPAAVAPKAVEKTKPLPPPISEQAGRILAHLDAHPGARDMEMLRIDLDDASLDELNAVRAHLVAKGSHLKRHFDGATGTKEQIAKAVYDAVAADLEQLKKLWEPAPKSPRKIAIAKTWHPDAEDAAYFSEDVAGIMRMSKPNPKLSDATRPAMNPNERLALAGYSDLAFGRMNAGLRRGGPLAPNCAVAHKHMQTLFAKAKVLAEPVPVVRGMSLSPEHAKQLADEYRAAMAGGTHVELSGYISTSTNPDIGKTFETTWTKTRGPSPVPVAVTIDAVHGLDMRGISHNEGEDEFLLNHQSRFEVASVTEEKGRLAVRLRQIPPTAKAKG